MICNGDYCTLDTTIVNTTSVNSNTNSKWLPPSSHTLWSIYGASWCSFCRKAKQLLLDKFDESDIYYYDIGCMDVNEFKSNMSSLTNNHTTIPMIFCGDVFIGGYTNLVEFLSKQ